MIAMSGTKPSWTVAKRPEQCAYKTTFTVGWATVRDDAGREIGSVNAKISGGVEVIVNSEEQSSSWILQISPQELWQAAQAFIEEAGR